MKIITLKKIRWGTLLFCIILLVSCNSTETENEEMLFEGWEEESSTEQQVKHQTTTAVSNNNLLKITGNKVNLRDKASLNSNVINQVNTGDVFEIKEKTAVEETIGQQTDFWYKIEKDGISAWIFGAFTSMNLNDNEQIFKGIYDGTEHGHYFYIHFKMNQNDKEYSFDFGQGGEDNNFSEFDLIKDEDKYKGKMFEVTWKVKLRTTYAGEGSMKAVKREVPVIVNLKLIE